MKNKIIYMVVGVLAIVASVLQEQGVFKFGEKSPQSEVITSSSASSNQTDIAENDYQQLIAAIENKKNDTLVKGLGEVIKVLKDDTHGSRHQRFIVKIGENMTLLVAHNIDLAPRVQNLSEGDIIGFYGEYEWNNKGGVVHWTHHDPAGRHVGGWLKHNGKTYQ